VKKKSQERRERRRLERELSCIPEDMLKKIFEWDRRLDGNPGETPRILELQWKDRGSLLAGITIERISPEGE